MEMNFKSKQMQVCVWQFNSMSLKSDESLCLSQTFVRSLDFLICKTKSGVPCLPISSILRFLLLVTLAYQCINISAVK